MPKFVLKDAYVELDGTDLSNLCSSVTINTPADEVDVTGFGAAFREFAQGLKDSTITLAMFQSFSTGETHDTLSPLHTSGDPFDVVIRPVASDAVATTNPEWTASVRLYDYSPLAAGVGEAATMDVTLRNASQTGIVEATS